MTVDAGFDLTGRRAVVTGASAGIGAAIASRLAGAGAHVVAVSRSGGAPGSGGRVEALAADLSDRAQLDGVIERSVDVLGGIDILVNNAGLADFVDLADVDRAHFDAMVSLNLWAPLRLCQQAHRHLRASGDGAVVMIGSIDAIRPSGGAAVYGATKAGLMGITVALAREWADSGVRINQVNPGLIDTPMAADAIAGLAAQKARFNIADRPGFGDEIAAQVHYLVAPVGRFATGRSFEIDGGALSLGPFTAFEEDD
jgi:NAD(P)-dependent dehydrogenase (short-subunit alcohol dehydrogenase family)